MLVRSELSRPNAESATPSCQAVTSRKFLSYFPPLRHQLFGEVSCVQSPFTASPSSPSSVAPALFPPLGTAQGVPLLRAGPQAEEEPPRTAEQRREAQRNPVERQATRAALLQQVGVQATGAPTFGRQGPNGTRQPATNGLPRRANVPKPGWSITITVARAATAVIRTAQEERRAGEDPPALEEARAEARRAGEAPATVPSRTRWSVTMASRRTAGTRLSTGKIKGPVA